MRRYFLVSRWRPRRGQVLASYRLASSKHPAEQLGEHHVNAGAQSELYSSEYQQQLKQLFHRFTRVNRRIAAPEG